MPSPRYIRYYFKPLFLRLKHIGATMEFIVNDKAVNNFRMIERHFFRDQLLKSFDFDFGYCIPNSINTCEHIYHVPNLSESLSKKFFFFILNFKQIFFFSSRNNRKSV